MTWMRRSQSTKQPTNAIKSTTNLTTETVESTALSLQSVDDIERGNSLALCVFSVGDGITDDGFEE